MNISAGQSVAWPAEVFRAKCSDLLACMNGVALFRIPADLTLPGIAAETVQHLNRPFLQRETATIDTRMQIRSKECSGCDQAVPEIVNPCTEEQLIYQPDRTPGCRLPTTNQDFHDQDW